MSFNFEFLKSIDKELEEMCINMENTIYSDATSAIIKGRRVAERISVKICEQESLEYVIKMSQYERLRELSNHGIIEGDIERAFDIVRYIGNKATHDKVDGEQEKALKVHRKIFKIINWYAVVYGQDISFEPREYIEPAIQLQEHLIEKIISDKIKLYMNNTFSSSSTLPEQTIPITGEELKQYAFQKMEGSYLLNELSKLRQSSNEAVEGAQDLSEFKSYLHINRSIQTEFINTLETTVEKDSAQLVMLCGSVGDGKSHLLAYVNKNHHKLAQNFQIHNDATESFDPKKSTLDTLAEVLANFDDNNIDTSKEKMILAINLGVLNNFLESEYCDKRFIKLKQMILKANIFDATSIAENYYSDNISIVSFSDYNLFELTENGIFSQYMETLLEKIVSNNGENPFYQAFKYDLESSYHSPVLINYQLLMSQNVREKVIKILIQSLIEHKKIVSTRELLNFIYEIIVPADIREYDKTDSILDKLDTLLPNLLFDNKERSSLLEIINFNDPINIRQQKIDNFMINLDISTNLIEVIESVLYIDEIGFLIKEISDLETMYDLSMRMRQKLVHTLIRFSYFFGKEISEVYIKNSYENYIRYLFFYNTQNPRQYVKLFDEIKEAVFNWKGSLKKDYIVLKDISGHFEISQKLDFTRHSTIGKSQKNDLGNRFKTSMNIDFKTRNGTVIPLNLDYKLYETIVKINNGYCPNKNDRENLIIFDDFIDKLMLHGAEENTLFIFETVERIAFNLEYDNDFGDDNFKFERVNL